MTEREKIIEIIESNKLCILDMDCNDCPYKDKLNKTYSCGSYKLADALIAANIGDVAEWKHRAEVAERALRSLAQLCAKGAKYYLQSDKAVKERERELYNEWIKQAEKELAEGKYEKY